MSFLNENVLVLNKLWGSIRIIRVIRSLKLLFSEKAYVVNSDTYDTYNWEEWIKQDIKDNDDLIIGVSFNIKVPEVIVLSTYDKVPKVNVKLTKKNIYIRDKYCCQYSGKKIEEEELDIDHVIPKSRGGKNDWGNMVVCTKEINRQKGDKTPKEAGLRLKNKPKKPTYKKMFIDTRIKIKESWKKFL